MLTSQVGVSAAGGNDGRQALPRPSKAFAPNFSVMSGEDNVLGAPYGLRHTLRVVLAGLIGAVTWNLITWYLGLPTSSSHALIGGYAGAAIANAGFRALIFNAKWPKGWLGTLVLDNIHQQHRFGPLPQLYLLTRSGAMGYKLPVIC